MIPRSFDVIKLHLERHLVAEMTFGAFKLYVTQGTDSKNNHSAEKKRLSRLIVNLYNQIVTNISVQVVAAPGWPTSIFFILSIGVET